MRMSVWIFGAFYWLYSDWFEHECVSECFGNSLPIEVCVRMTDWFFGAGRSERKSDCIAPFISRHSLFHFNGSLIFSLGVLSNSLYSFLCHVCLVSCVVYGHCSWCSSASTCDVTLRPVLLISLYLSSSIFSFRLLRCCSLCQQLLIYLHDVQDTFHSNHHVDVFYLDIKKAGPSQWASN